MMGAFDPFSPAILAAPYGSYEWLRDEAPVYHVPGTDIWAISRFSDVEATLRNHAVFSSTGGVGPAWEQVPMMSMHDPPEHTRLRRIVAKHFTPRYLASFVPRMQATTDALIDALARRGGGDFVGDFAEPLIAGLIADLLGIPDERRADFRRWSVAIVSALASGLDEAAAREAERQRAEFVAYLKNVVAERRSDSGHGAADERQDIIRLLVRAGENEMLSPRETTAFCVLLLVAGFETMVNGLVNIAHIVMTEEGVWSAAGLDLALVPSLIEEGLRFESPVQAFFRNTLRPAEVSGVTIPERQKVMILFGAANRDPRKYADPEFFQLRRNPVDHLGFGAGIHHCIGAPLARLQYAIVWRTLLGRLSTMEMAGEAIRTHNALLRGFRQLPVRVQMR